MSHAVRGVGAVLLAVAVASGTGAAGMAAPPAFVASLTPNATRASSFCPDRQEQEFLRLINGYRAQHGLRALGLSRTLGAAARHHSVQMANQDYFSHTMLNGVSWVENVIKHGYTFNTYRGENIAAGRATAADVFDQWRRSPEHNANMLSAHFTAIGIGRAYKGSSRFDWYWTTDFGGVFDTGPAC